MEGKRWHDKQKLLTRARNNGKESCQKGKWRVGNDNIRVPKHIKGEFTSEITITWGYGSPIFIKNLAKTFNSDKGNRFKL